MLGLLIDSLGDPFYRKIRLILLALQRSRYTEFLFRFRLPLFDVEGPIASHERFASRHHEA
jgi:hypothetical protein